MMKTTKPFLLMLILPFLLGSCVTQKKYAALKSDMDKLTSELHACNEQKALCQSDLKVCQASLMGKQDQYNMLSDQLNDCKTQRDKQLTQVGDLTVLSKSANDNINQTLSQLENKDKYIQMLLAAKTKADSINLALAVNLKGVLKEGLDDNDVEIKVDKTVVFINLSDKMLYNSGSYTLTAKAKTVLGKIATIVSSRPEVDVMVEGYTDNKAISNNCISDNWDLSVKRATSVVRVLQNDYKIDPNKLIAAGRGEYNTLAANDTEEGRSTNRRTRIIIMPKLNQFYDLLDPSKAAK
ncbi:MAG TPA: OmpA family protein [Chitinophagales bacterium]|nr:OmpA family protein [Chitinophagales bacterium]